MSLRKTLVGFWFVYGLFAAVALAWVFPDWGGAGGWMHSHLTTRIGIFIIFSLQGLLLPTEELAHGLTRWRLHVQVQGTIFVAIPVLAGLLVGGLREQLGPELWIGFLFLAILPCTISTSVVFVTQSDGNVAAALFNTSLANLVGIFIVPTFCSWLVHAEGQGVPLLPLFGNILILLLLPLVLGQTVRFFVPALRHWALGHRKLISRTNSCIVLFIVYCSFCGSFLSRFWEGLDNGVLGLTFALALALLLLAMGFSLGVIRLTRKNYPDAVVAFFCGTQKTIAAGIPMAQGIFAATQYDLGLVLLPLMFYAPMQFTIGGIIVALLERRQAGRAESCACDRTDH